MSASGVQTWEVAEKSFLLFQQICEVQYIVQYIYIKHLKYTVQTELQESYLLEGFTLLRSGQIQMHLECCL